jgi:hypothetical protein
MFPSSTNSPTLSESACSARDKPSKSPDCREENAPSLAEEDSNCCVRRTGILRLRAVLAFADVFLPDCFLLTDFLGRLTRFLAISDFLGLLFVFFLFGGHGCSLPPRFIPGRERRDPLFQQSEFVASAKKSHRDLFLAVRKCISWTHLTELLIATAALFRPLLPRGLSHFRFLAVKSPASSFWK